MVDGWDVGPDGLVMVVMSVVVGDKIGVMVCSSISVLDEPICILLLLLGLRG